MTVLFAFSSAAADKFSNFQILKLLIQLLSLLLLNWFIHTILPVVVQTLMRGMLEWNAVSVVFCWSIQIGFLIVSFSLRDHLMLQAKKWQKKVPSWMKHILLLGKSWVCLSGAWLVIDAIPGFSFLVLGELMLLLLQIYCWVGIVGLIGRVIR